MNNRFQFSVAFCLLVTSIVAILIGWAIDHRRLDRERRRIADELRKASARESAVIVLSQSRHEVGLDSEGNPVSISFNPYAMATEDLAQLRHLPTIRTVRLYGHTKLNDDSLEYLLDLPELESLHLDAQNSSYGEYYSNSTYQVDRITDEQLKTLSKISSLKILSLRYLEFSDEGLLQLGALSNLRSLEFRHDQAAESTINTLRSELPDAGIFDFRLRNTPLDSD